MENYALMYSRCVKDPMYERTLITDLLVTGRFKTFDIRSCTISPALSSRLPWNRWNFCSRKKNTKTDLWRWHQELKCLFNGTSQEVNHLSSIKEMELLRFLLQNVRHYGTVSSKWRNLKRRPVDSER
jgi:hypothetical protein